MAALYVADAAQIAAGSSLTPFAFLILLLPGFLAAWMSSRSGFAWDPEKEAVVTGVAVATFASALLVVVLILGVTGIDWAAYEQQVGAQIASGVRDAAIPAALIAGLISVGVVFAVCVSLSWLGSVLYLRLTGSR